MLEFLKNLFLPSFEKEDVKRDNLLVWFEDKTVNSYNSLSEDISERYNKLREEITSLRAGIANLENAQIKEEVEERVKSVVLGNRSNYINQLGLFLQEMEIPDDRNYQIAANFTKKVDSKLNTLAENTTKSYYTSQHLFYNEVQEIAANVSSISKINEDIKKSIKDNNVDKLIKIREKITNLLNKDEIKSKIHEEINTKRLERAELIKSRNSVMNDIIIIENSKEFQDYTKVKEKESQINKEFNSTQDNILQLFFPLERSLKKLKRVTVVDEKLIERYIEHPVETLVSDTSFKIVKILENLERNINAGSVELKDIKEREKTLAKISEINKERLVNLVNKFKENEKAKKEIISFVEKFKIVKERKVREEELERLNKQITYLDEELKDLTEKSEIDFETLEQDIVEDIAKYLRIKVTLWTDEKQEQVSQPTSQEHQ